MADKDLKKNLVQLCATEDGEVRYWHGFKKIDSKVIPINKPHLAKISKGLNVQGAIIKEAPEMANAYIEGNIIIDKDKEHWQVVQYYKII